MIKLEITKSRENPFQQHSFQVAAQTIPDNWQTLLVLSWSTHLSIDKSRLGEQLNIHIGPESTYSKREELIQGLKEIYLCLVNQSKKILSEEEKQMLLLTISASTDACSPGFHNRIMDAQQFIQLPCSLEQFMLQIRTEIVDKAARRFSSDVHDHNKIFLCARSIFGVNVANDSDPYIHNNPSLNIEEVHLYLDEQFKRHYQPLQLTSQIEQKLVKIFHQQFGYAGFQEAGYDEALYQQTLSYLNQIFRNPNLSITDYFVIDGIKTQDINWTKIRLSIVEYMIQKHIIRCSEFEKFILTKYILGEKNLDPNFLLLINNEIEFICFIKLFLIAHPGVCKQYFLNYLSSLSPSKVIHICSNLIQFSEQPDIVLGILKQVNTTFPFAPFMLQNEHEFEGFLLIGIEANRQLTALLSLLNFLSPQQLRTVLRQRDILQNNILTITADKPETYFQELIAYIQPRIEPDLMFELLCHSDINNKNALILAYESQTKNHKTILSLIETLDKAKKRKIFSKTTSNGFNCLDAAINHGNEEFKSLLKFIHEYQPELLPTLVRHVNFNGLNFLAQVIKFHHEELPVLLPYLIEFDAEYLFEIMQQNNTEGKHALLLCAKYCPQFISDILQLLNKLDTDDAHSILKKLTKTKKSILHVMKKAPYEFLHDLLSFVDQYYPSLLTFILCPQEEYLIHPLFQMIEQNGISIQNFMEFVNLIPLKYQYALLTSVNEDEFSLLACAVMYKPEQLDVLIVNLLQHFKKDYAEDLVYFFYDQLIKLNHHHRKIQFIFEKLLVADSSALSLIKSEFICHLLNVIIAHASKKPVLKFGGIFLRFIHNPQSEITNLFLDMLFTCCANHTEVQAKLFIENILNDLVSQPIEEQEKLTPYLFLMFKNLRRQFPSIAQSILTYFNFQHQSIKLMFYKQKDNFGESILLCSVYRDYETLSMLMKIIQSLSLNDQFQIITQRNNFGGNLITNLLIHQSDDQHIQANLPHYIAQIFSLPVNFQRALLVPDTNSNILGLVIKAIPDFFEIFITQIQKIDSELVEEEKLEHLIMRHYSPKILSVGLVAAQQKSFNFSIFINYLKKINNDLLFAILNQAEETNTFQAFFQAPAQQKTIFSYVLPNIPISTLNALILETQRLSLERQRSIIDKTSLEQISSIPPEILAAFQNYQESLKPLVKRKNQ